MSKTTKRVFLTRAAEYKINTALEVVLTKTGDGIVAYDAEWDDKRVAEHVAKETGEAVNVEHVRTLRQELFGKIRHWRKKEETAEDATELANQIAALIARVDTLEEKVRELSDDKDVKRALANGSWSNRTI